MKIALAFALLPLPPLFAQAQNSEPAPSENPMAAVAGLIQAFQGTNGGDGAGGGEEGGMMAAAAQFLGAIKGGTNNPLAAMGAKPAVDFRELRALLPEEVAGLRRTNASGEKTGSFGVSVSEATGVYGGDEGPRLDIKITDLGAMGPAAAMASFGWATTEVDSEGDQGYERTAEYKGRKGLEQYATADKSGSVKVMSGGRFMVEITGNNIEPAQLRTAAEAIDFDALDRLGNRPQVE